MPEIHLKTPSAEYTIDIGAGLLRTLPRRLRELSGGRERRLFLVTSPEIWKLWCAPVTAVFAEAGQPAPELLLLAAGERHKRLRSIERLAEQLAVSRADRDSLLLAFGGGVVGDMTGFLAAIYMRGIDFVQIPTTLLAQVDSSVGGKTGANLGAGKNLIGAFHHPLLVLADTDTLRTLPPAELRSGLQEAIKAGIIRDPELFQFLKTAADAVLDPQHPEHGRAIARVVADSVRVKADVVAGDERESGLRMILNFGHTLGHAIEAATNYRQVLHGEAVAWGSIAAIELSLQRGTLARDDGERMVALILRYGPFSRFRATAGKLVELTARDKKNRSGTLSFVLPTAIGAVEIVRDVTPAELQAAAEAMLRRMRQATS